LNSAILTGPYLESFREVFDALFAAGGAIVVSDALTLASEVIRLWRDETARASQLAAARSTVNQGAEAFERTVSALAALIKAPSGAQSKVDASA
jgi:3-deoxy-D-manno-octulosonic-acid transferase